MNFWIFPLKKDWKHIFTWENNFVVNLIMELFSFHSNVSLLHYSKKFYKNNYFIIIEGIIHVYRSFWSWISSKKD